MNIIYFGDFEKPYDTELYIARAFRELGHNVTCFQESRTKIFQPDNIVEEIKQMGVELVLFSKGKPPGDSQSMIEMLKENGIKTAVWLFDLYFGLQSGRKEHLIRKIAPFNAEYIFSTDGGHQEEFEKYGIKHKLLRQGIYEAEAILYDRPKTKDVIFVGNDAFKTREKMLTKLEERYGTRFEWWGRPNKVVRNLPLNELYASTKVVVGDSQPSPYYWSNRIYETLGRGGFLIHPYVKGLEDEFEIGKHLVTYEYGNLEDLFAKIDYYLAHDEEREAIRKAGFEHVKNNYTYKQRCQKLLEMIA